MKKLFATILLLLFVVRLFAGTPEHNLLGVRVLETTTAFSTELQLPVSSLPAGIYLLSVVQGNYREVVKVVR